MAKLITVDRAKKEIQRLQEYVDLVEKYKTDTLGEVVIKEYAITNSIAEVTRRLNNYGITQDGKTIEKKDVLEIIMSKPKDELHRVLKSGYLSRTKHIRKNSEVVTFSIIKALQK